MNSLIEFYKVSGILLLICISLYTIARIFIPSIILPLTKFLMREYSTIISFLILINTLYYVGWVFYISEPTYIDNCYKPIERYDYVSVSGRYYHTKGEVENGLILQRDSTSALIKCKRPFPYMNFNYYQLNIKEDTYRIIGKGTIYHKINDYVGFNLMVITQIIIGILAGCLIFALTPIITKFLKI